MPLQPCRRLMRNRSLGGMRDPSRAAAEVFGGPCRAYGPGLKRRVHDRGVRQAARAGVVELADTPDLGSGGASRGGSSPSARTTVPCGVAFDEVVYPWGNVRPMQVTETLSEGLKRGFTVVVPGEDIESRRTARLTDLGKTLRLPGFRPGKVPLPIVRQRYGNAVTAEVLEESVNQATEKVLSERNMRPAQTPKIDLVSTDMPAPAPPRTWNSRSNSSCCRTSPCRISARSAWSAARRRCRRSWSTRRWRKWPPATGTLVEITPEELAARAEHPGAATGEVLTVDFVGKIDGDAVPQRCGQRHQRRTRRHRLHPGFRRPTGRDAARARAGRSRSPSRRSTANKDLAGKAATFDITAKKLSRPVVPAVDDELAKKLAFDDLAELRRVMTERYQREYDAHVPRPAEARIARRPGRARQLPGAAGHGRSGIRANLAAAGGRAQGRPARRGRQG